MGSGVGITALTTLAAPGDPGGEDGGGEERTGWEGEDEEVEEEDDDDDEEEEEHDDDEEDDADVEKGSGEEAGIDAGVTRAGAAAAFTVDGVKTEAEGAAAETTAVVVPVGCVGATAAETAAAGGVDVDVDAEGGAVTLPVLVPVPPLYGLSML